MGIIQNQHLKQVGFIILILLLGTLLFLELSPFIPGFLGAVTFYVLCRRVMFYLVEKRRWPAPAGAALVMVLSFVIILLPFGLLFNMLASKASFAIEHYADLAGSIKQLNGRIQQSVGFDPLSPERMQQMQSKLAIVVPNLLGATFSSITSIVIMYFILYFMLTSARAMETSLHKNIPLKEENVVRMGKEVHTMVIANAVVIPLIAILQGTVAGLGYWLLGVHQPVFWGVVTAFASLLPVIGAAAVYVPLGLYVLATGGTWYGLGLLLYGFLIVGTVDNVFRFMLAKRIGDVHPLITIFGVLIGLNIFGFIGIVFGPLLISMFLLLLKIYANEFSQHTKENLQHPA
ncbi:Predicted PurR-regulated permease PerM [Chitinophaga costaii]|uniref:Predicted PurR-regulated permease PerM n=1 Tax=Chitinophaga costaii TaxID=1335309 RepID=A0A1C4AF49_9BACT|nr:AI-2E family transporter [Chitinophaga costaii]PUZ26581.1 AI-2E family transporter [Chitinophaga costaii]SCB93244.1 Predicted PurR-regulated permease PerM [Chitinophaga costaii]